MPPARIAAAADEIRALLAEHGFLSGVAGHASAGNLHFMLTPDFSKPEDRERYERFMAALVTLVLDGYDGSLKAEHGTGVNMAPFVEREWGRTATEMMWRIKELADPAGILGPGVVLNRDPGCHLEGLKTTPPIEEVGDDLRRVRLLRARLPEPRPDDDATPADRPPPRDGPPASRLAAAREADRGVRVRRPRDLRGRRDVRDDLPARDRHRRPRQGAPRRRARRARGTGSAAGRAALGPRRGRRSLRPGLGIGDLAGGRGAGRGARPPAPPGG